MSRFWQSVLAAAGIVLLVSGAPARGDEKDKAALEVAKTDLAKAEANLKRSEAELKRTKELLRTRAVTASDYDESEAQRDIARAEVSVKQEAVNRFVKPAKDRAEVEVAFA